MSFFHFHFEDFSCFPLEENFKNEATLTLNGKVALESINNNIIIGFLLFCFTLYKHLTSSARVFHGLEIVYCFFFALFCCMFFPSTLNIFQKSRLLHLLNMQERRSNSLLCCFMLLFHDVLWAFYATVFRLLRLFYNKKTAVDGKRQSEQNGWCWVEVIMNKFKRYR